MQCLPCRFAGDWRGEHPAGRMLAERLNSLLAIRGQRDPVTGCIQPLVIDQLYLLILDKYGQPEFSLRHIERCATGRAKPTIEKIWLLADTLGVRNSLLRIASCGIATAGDLQESSI